MTKRPTSLTRQHSSSRARGARHAKRDTHSSELFAEFKLRVQRVKPHGEKPCSVLDLSENVNSRGQSHLGKSLGDEGHVPQSNDPTYALKLGSGNSVALDNLVLAMRDLPDDMRAAIARRLLPELDPILEAIERAVEEFNKKRDEFRRPPLPKLTKTQEVKIRVKLKENPWTKRRNDDLDSLHWIADLFGEFVGKGLLQTHLKGDKALYEAFLKRVRTDGLPDWLDVPSAGDAHIRGLVDPVRQIRALTARYVVTVGNKLASRMEPR